MSKSLMKEKKMDLAILVKIKRDSLGLSQREFAVILGLKENGERTVSGWERGEHIPSLKKLTDINNLSTEIPFKDHAKNAKFDFIDLFAGIGGIRLPFQKLGGHCVFSSENNRFSQKTYAANYGEVPNGDITQISSDEVPEHDLLLAGFPCQAFSGAGLRKGFLDTRGTMFFEIQRLLVEKRPKMFLLENVKQLKGHDGGNTLKTILETLKGTNNKKIPKDIDLSIETRKSLNTKLNYAVDYRVLRATNFGVPQKRERIYIVGFDRDQFEHLDLDKKIKQIFDELDSRKSSTCLGDILEDNASLDKKYTISNRLLAGHERRKIEHRSKGNGFGFSLFNRDSEYCNTMSARYYKDGSEILIDQSDINENPRKLTPRECARIQGFPEDFVIDAVSDTQIYRQFGNSVSMPVISEIAKLMIEILEV